MNFQVRVGCVDYTSYLVEKVEHDSTTSALQKQRSSQLSYNPLKRYLFVSSEV